MYGDPDALDQLAHQLTVRAQVVRDRLSTRMRQCEAAGWESSAADAWRVRVREETHRGAGAADRLDEAAAALRAHAARCREVMAQIAAVEARVSGWFEDRFAQLKSAAGMAVPGAEQALADLGRAAASLPSPGHAGWLDVPAALRGLGL